MYKGQISKSGIAILPSKRTRKIPDLKKVEVTDSQIKASGDNVNEPVQEEPLTLSEEVETKD